LLVSACSISEFRWRTCFDAFIAGNSLHEILTIFRLLQDTFRYAIALLLMILFPHTRRHEDGWIEPCASAYRCHARPARAARRIVATADAIYYAAAAVTRRSAARRQATRQMPAPLLEATALTTEG
jgi:hypothetical protein